MLRTGCIFDERKPEDGRRIIVMSRLTETDGQTQLLKLVKGIGFKDWSLTLAVPDKVVGKYYRTKETDPQAFQTLECAYRDYLSTSDAREEVLRWATYALKKDITFLCFESTPELCHRRILAEECKHLVPSLDVYIR